MKIRNPNYKSPAVIKAEKAAAKLAQYVNAQPVDVEFVTFDAIREVVDAANLTGVTSNDLPDNMLEHIAGLSGLEIVNG